MRALGKVASLAFQTLVSVDDLKIGIVEREKAEAAFASSTKRW